MPAPATHSTAPGSLGLLVALLAAGCDGSLSGPPDGVQIVAGATLTDTVEAEPAQALVAEVSPWGHTRPGLLVRFEGVALDPSAPYVLVGRLDSDQFSAVAIDTTDSRGRALARLKMGRIAGRALIRVTVPAHGFVDSAYATVEPGAGVALRAMPRDTAVQIGRSFTARAAIVDRFGNPRTDPVTLMAATPNLNVTGVQVMGASITRGLVRAAAGTLRDSILVSVVPVGTLAALEFSELLVFDTDGANLRRLPVFLEGFTTHWAPGGAEVVVGAGDGTLRIVNMLGHVRPATPLPTTGRQYYPRYAADGQWLYYCQEEMTEWIVRRVRPNGTGDESVPAVPSGRCAPAPSPNGLQLAVVQVSGGGGDLLEVFEFASGELRLLANPGHNPSWSPNGNQIAYLNPASLEIRLIAPDGTGTRVLSPDGGEYAFGFDWSPDSRWIVAYSGSRGMLEIVDAGTGSRLPLPYAIGWHGPSWRR